MVILVFLIIPLVVDALGVTLTTAQRAVYNTHMMPKISKHIGGLNTLNTDIDALFAHLPLL